MNSVLLMLVINKKNKKTAFAFSLLAVMAAYVFAGGCAETMDNLIRERYDGRSAVYPVSRDKAWEITRTVLLEAGAKPAEIEEDRAGNVINWVSVLGVFIEPVDTERTRVTAQRPPAPCNPLPPPLTEDMFLERFDTAVNLLKSGKPLPAPLPK
jgi:hypothetical protein